MYMCIYIHIHITVYVYYYIFDIYVIYTCIDLRRPVPLVIVITIISLRWLVQLATEHTHVQLHVAGI